MSAAEGLELTAMRSLLTRVKRSVGRTYPVLPIGAAVLARGQMLGTAVASARRPEPVTALVRHAGRGRTVLMTLAHAPTPGARRALVDALDMIGARRLRIAVRAPRSAPLMRALREAGIEVQSGLLEARAREIHRAELHFLTRGRPFVTLKVATSLDGRIAVASGDSKWITGPLSRREAHRLRARHASILVGAGTVVADDPRLDVRAVAGVDPAPVVLDSRLMTFASGRSRLLQRPGVLFIHTAEASKAARSRLASVGADALELPAEPEGHPSVDAILDALGARGVVSLMVEGGGRVLGRFLGAGACDELHLFQAPRVLGEGPGPFTGLRFEQVADAPRFEVVRRKALGDDVHAILRPRR